MRFTKIKTFTWDFSNVQALSRQLVFILSLLMRFFSRVGFSEALAAFEANLRRALSGRAADGSQTQQGLAAPYLGDDFEPTAHTLGDTQQHCVI